VKECLGAQARPAGSNPIGGDYELVMIREVLFLILINGLALDAGNLQPVEKLEDEAAARRTSVPGGKA